MNKFEKARGGLMSSDFEIHKRALDDLLALRHSRKHSLAILELATHAYPLDDHLVGSTSAEILKMFQGEPPPGFVAAVERIYDDLQDKCGAREMALRCLMNMETEESFRAVVRLLSRPSSRTVGLNTSLYVPLRETPAIGLCMFPGLFEVLPNLNDRAAVYQVILAYAKARLLDVNGQAAFGDYCLQRSTAILDTECGDRAGERTEAEQRAHLIAFLELDMLLDLLRFFEDSAVDKLLRRVVDGGSLFPDLPAIEGLKLKLFATCSLLGRGQSLDLGLLESIGATPQLRWRLWEQLAEVGRLDAFPSHYRDQQLLAEAEMVQ
jgi:hypothetical protein